MNGGESKFWRNDLRTGFNSMGHSDRIESHSSALGRPDVNVCLIGGIIWDIELKYCDAGSVVLRPAQKMWIRRRQGVGGNAAVITKAVLSTGQILYLWNLRYPDNKILRDWIDYADHTWEDKINWVDFEEILRAKKSE